MNMARALKKAKRPANRPLIDIDWKRVDKLLIAGCPGTKIADAIGVCADTLYDRCEQEKGVTFSAYSQQKKQCGDALLQEAQFDKAIGNTDKGDNTLLIWLGKTRLEQRESIGVTVAPEQVKNFESLMKEVAEAQQNGHNVSLFKTQNEDENGTRDSD